MDGPAPAGVALRAVEDSQLIGKLVVATASLVDPNFHLTATLILEHGEHGALGVVLNRPSETPVEDVLPDWRAVASDPKVVFQGGPVQPSTVIALARSASGAPDGWQQVAGTLGVLDLDTDPLDVAGAIDGLRVFAGYAGWGAGQLEAEVGTGAWFVVDGLPDDPFCADPDELWRRVLRRQGGLFTTVAVNPTLN
jgi:putative transcriptional regulator